MNLNLSKFVCIKKRKYLLENIGAGFKHPTLLRIFSFYNHKDFLKEISKKYFNGVGYFKKIVNLQNRINFLNQWKH